MQRVLAAFLLSPQSNESAFLGGADSIETSFFKNSTTKTSFFRNNVPIPLDAQQTSLSALCTLLIDYFLSFFISNKSCELSRVTRMMSLERHFAVHPHCIGAEAETSEIDIWQTGNQYLHDCIVKGPFMESKHLLLSDVGASCVLLRCSVHI